MTNLVELVGPDERALRDDLAGGRFLAGVEAGRWRLLRLEWPRALIAIAAAPRAKGPREFVLNFELSGYPAVAPTAGPWDIDADSILGADKRPKGVRVGHIFRSDWQDGSALYAPWDRIAADHGDWRTRHALFAWNPQRDITFYLACVHDVLNTDDYVGV